MKRHDLIFIALILLIPIIFSGRLSYYVSILAISGIYAIIVLGLHLLMGYAGQVSLGHAAFFAIGAYCSAILSTRYGFSPLLAFAPSVIITGTIAFFIGLPTLKLKEHYLAMATLGIGMIVYSVVKADPFGLTGGITGISDIPPITVFGFATNSDKSQYYTIWTIAVILLIFSRNIADSGFGRALTAIHKSETTASVLGINVHRYKLQVFVLSGVYAGIAGCLYAHCSPLFYLNPDDVCHILLSIKLLTMVVIGGMKHFWGAIAGAVGLSILPEILRMMGSLLHGVGATELEMAVYGMILITIMIIRLKRSE